MIRVYYTLQPTRSDDFIESVLKDRLSIPDRTILRTKFGKPYLKNGNVRFNLSNSGNLTVLAVSDEEVGIDCELLKERNLNAIMRRFSESEKSCIHDLESFYRNWTAKESFVKYCGSSIAKDLSHLEYRGGKMYFHGVLQNVHFATFPIHNNIVSICAPSSEISLINTDVI